MQIWRDDGDNGAVTIMMMIMTIKVKVMMILLMMIAATMVKFSKDRRGWVELGKSDR